MAGGRRLAAALLGLGVVAAGSAGADVPYPEASYWDKVYTAVPKLTSGPLMSSWQGVGYQQLVGILMPLLSRMQARRVIVLGSGDSPLPEELSDAGLSDIVAVDFSEEVIAAMRRRNGDTRPGLKWLVEDVRKLSSSDDSFSLAVDVGTLDTLATGEEKDAEAMIQEVRRVLRADGSFVSVSSEPQAFRSRLLQKHLPPQGWNITTVFLPRPREIDRRIHDLNPDFHPGQLTAYVITPVTEDAAAQDSRESDGGSSQQEPFAGAEAHLQSVDDAVPVEASPDEAAPRVVEEVLTADAGPAQSDEAALQAGEASEDAPQVPEPGVKSERTADSEAPSDEAEVATDKAVGVSDAGEAEVLPLRSDSDNLEGPPAGNAASELQPEAASSGAATIEAEAPSQPASDVQEAPSAGSEAPSGEAASGADGQEEPSATGEAAGGDAGGGEEVLSRSDADNQDGPAGQPEVTAAPGLIEGEEAPAVPPVDAPAEAPQQVPDDLAT